MKAKLWNGHSIAQPRSATNPQVFPSAAAAASGADVVVTVVPDAAAIESFALGADGFLPALGPAGNGSRMKMVTNGWIMSSVAATAEAMAPAKALGLDGAGFLEGIEGTALDMGYAQSKGQMMLDGFYPASMRLANGAKDARLVSEAAHDAGLAGAVARRWREKVKQSPRRQSSAHGYA